MRYLSEEQKQARKEYQKQYRERNKERLKKQKQEYYQKNKKQIIERVRQHTEDNAEHRAEYLSNYYTKNKDKLQEYKKEYYSDPEKLEQKRQKDREYYENNKAKCVANATRRKKKVRKATPDWLTEEHKAEITGFYEEAKRLEAETGDKYHVDHIVPLQGESVSGLNVPWNLQVLPAAENIAKSNKFDID